MTIHVVDHPLLHHKLSLIRDRKTPGSLFRALIEEVGLILATGWLSQDQIHGGRQAGSHPPAGRKQVVAPHRMADGKQHRRHQVHGGGGCRTGWPTVTASAPPGPGKRWWRDKLPRHEPRLPPRPARCNGGFGCSP